MLDQPRWELDHAYSIDNHFEIVELNNVNEKIDVADVVGRVFAERFELNDKSCWKATFITNIQGDGDVRQSALFITCHHALGDGQAFVRGLLKFVSCIARPTGKMGEDELVALQYSAGMNSKKYKKDLSLVSSIGNALFQIFMFLYGKFMNLTEFRDFDCACNCL